jgi:ArsR family metal-binding transcriptional regulator
MTQLESALISSEQAEDLKEAREIVKEMKERVNDGEDPEEILHEHGLEPDYIFDLLY